MSAGLPLAAGDRCESVWRPGPAWLLTEIHLQLQWSVRVKHGISRRGGEHCTAAAPPLQSARQLLLHHCI